MKLRLKSRSLSPSVVTGVVIVCGIAHIFFFLSASKAYACNDFLGSLDPTCPGRILNPTNGGTSPSKLPTQVDLGLSREKVVWSYQTAFGRNPSQGEIDSWISADRQQRVDTNMLITSHRSHLRRGGDLDGTIMRSYQTVLSRNPAPAEMNYWRQIIRAEGRIYDELVQSHRNYLRDGGR